MSEVDRLSNSGLYPALPISDRKRERNESSNKPPPEPLPEPRPDDIESSAARRRPPKSLIDEYA